MKASRPKSSPSASGSAVRREAGHDGLFQSLVRSKENQSGIFDTMREAMAFLAALAFSQRRKVPLDGKTLTLDGSVFENQNSQLFLLSLAAADEGERRFLKSEAEYAPPEVYAIFEQYVNGGLYVLAEWRKQTKYPENISASLIEFLKSYGFMGQVESRSA
jgi:dnd system-associated protein 4